MAILVGVAVGTTRTSHAEDGIPDGPIDPNNGEQTLLDVINGIPVNDIHNALNNFPIPYVVYATAGGADPVITNNRAGSPTRIDADRSKSTGQGNSGQDLIIEVNTVLAPTPGLLLTVRRLGNAPFASDLQVVIAFPFSAFGSAASNGPSPNLFLGYQTTAAFDGSGYPAGGHAPERVDFFITPGQLAGTDHTFDLTINTVGSSNPLRFLAGHFEAPAGGTIQDAIGMGIHTDPVPATINLGITTAASLPGAGATTGSFGVDWSASQPSRVTFDYIEAESYPFTVPDYGTTVVFDQMPTQQTVDVDVDFNARTINLAMAGNAPINDVIVSHRRSDGLDILLEAQQVPTEVEVALDLNGSVAINVNANTMDFELTATQEGGFPGTSALFGYPMEFFYVAATDVPDTLATWDVANATFSVAAVNPGEFIGSLAFVIDDDGRSIDDPKVELPPTQPGFTGFNPWNSHRHVFSLVDDGTHGTAAARILQVIEANLNFDSPSLEDIQSVYQLNLAQPAQPLTGYVKLGEDSQFFDKPIEATCNIHDFPYGVTTFTLELPPPKVKFGYETEDDQRIDEVHCWGNIGTLNFDVAGADLPPGFDFDFDPAGSLDVVAELSNGSPSYAGMLAVRLWDSIDANGLGLSTNVLFDKVLRDARARVDQLPSFNATWLNDAAKTEIKYDTVGNQFMGGAQIAVSTHIEFTSQLPAPSSATPHYLHFRDDGGDDLKHLRAGIFGLDSFNYTSSQAGDERSLSVTYNGDIDRELEATFKSAFEGKYFPAYELDLAFGVNKVPQTWSVSTDFATSLLYVASSGIEDITLGGTISQKSGDDVHTTNVDILLDDLPAGLDFSLDARANGSAELGMSAPVGAIRAEFWSDTSILGEPYRHILLEINDIPANWLVEWGISNPNPHGNVRADAPLGTVKAIVSRGTRAETAGKYAPFEAAGGEVHYSAYLSEVDRRYVRVGSGDANAREQALHGRLLELYSATAQLDDGEDHLILRRNGSGEIDFLSVQGTGFQCASAQVGTGSFQCVNATVSAGEINASLLIPTSGNHPFYVGLQDQAGEFTVVQVPNIPDSASVIVGSSRAWADFNASAGDILVYQGALPSAGETGDALKLLLKNTPSSVRANWNLGFPGSVNITSSNPLEVLLLSQDNATRTVGGFRVGNLSASWGINAVDTDEKCQLDPPGCGLYLQFAKVFFNFSATPALDAFIFSYDRVGSPLALQPAGPAADGGEWVPVVSFLMEGFSRFEASAQIEICYFGVCPLGIPLPNIDISTDLLGSFNVDFWDKGGGPLDILGDPDYFENNPWHVYPPLHSPGSHHFPFRP